MTKEVGKLGKFLPNLMMHFSAVVIIMKSYYISKDESNILLPSEVCALHNDNGEVIVLCVFLPN